MSLTTMNLKEFSKVVDQISREKGISKTRVVETMESAIGAAYKKEYGKKGEVVRAKLDFDKNDITFTQVRTVVDPEMVRVVEEEEEGEGGGAGEDSGTKTVSNISEIEVKAEDEKEKKPRYNPSRHIFLEEAKNIKKDAEPDDELEFPLEMHEDFGRIAAQTAKQVIIQKIREAERESVFDEYKSKENELVSGIVQNYERGNVYVNLGKATGVMFANETIPTEHYSVGQRLRFLVLAVQEETRLPGIVLSRSHPGFVEKLFELEVPEIAEGVIEIKAIAREPGSRTKIAVASTEDNIDPVGSCVGQRGSRVMAVITELGQEKIDIIPWSEEVDDFIGNSLSPAKVKFVEVKPRREVLVFVGEDQLSLAIGKGGQNVRLAAKLTGWKIDVRSQTEPEKAQDGDATTSSADVGDDGSDSDNDEGIESIPGVGPKAAKALRASGFDSLSKLRDAAEEDIAAVPGIGAKTVKKMLEYLRNN